MREPTEAEYAAALKLGMAVEQLQVILDVYVEEAARLARERRDKARGVG